MTQTPLYANICSMDSESFRSATTGNYGMDAGKPPRAPAGFEIGEPVWVLLADGTRKTGIFMTSRRPRKDADYRDRAEHAVELLVAMKDPFDYKNAMVFRWFPITQCRPIDLRDK